MLHEIRDSKIFRLVQKRNLLIVGLSFAVLLNIIQSVAVAYLVQNTRVIIVPPEIRQEFWVEPKAVSHEYLRQMSDYFLALFLNVTPDSTQAKRDIILKFIHPKGYGAVKEQLIVDAQAIKKNSISRFFTPIKYEVNNTERWVKALGDVTTLVGQEKVSVVRTKYKIQYQFDQGQAFISEFVEVDKDA